MAVYKIFPTKDATLYSAYPNMNTGDDAMLEIYNLNPNENPSPRVARAILGFDGNQINQYLVDFIGYNYNWEINLKLYIAEAQGINQNTTLEAKIITGSWSNGTGQYNDDPQSINGVSWNYKHYSGSESWSTPGGDIYTPTPLPIPFPESTQSFDRRSIKDLSLNIGKLVYTQYYRDDPYNFILKLIDDQEFISGSANQPLLKFFSVDTNTIYPPHLELKWDDFTTSSNAPTEIHTSNLSLSLDENPGVFYPESVNRFRLNVRPTYPTRTFQTASLYTTNYSLPTASYYAIKDLDTNEYVVDFDENYTKISNDERGNYFDIYMNGLEPERYYKILIQTTINNTTLVKDDNYIFKVING